jgi:2-polyprenyl-3-methyl-5-hydroxy-6-metoxy-1,4-benzoquinol methylase
MSREIDQDRMDQAIEQIQGSFAGAATVLMAHLGESLGLYDELIENGPASPTELADRTGLASRYLEEWLSQQAVVGLVDHDATTGRFSLPPEHGMLLTSEETPTTYAGGLEAIAGMFLSLDSVTRAFRDGGGIDWGDHDERVQRGTARFFGSSYRQSLVDDWVPELGMEEKLREGASVADVGCGQGITTILLAKAYPRSRFVGIDAHEESIEAARERASDADVDDRVDFEVADVARLDGGPYDIIWLFDVFHDLGDPAGAASHVRGQLSEDGILALVEPFAADTLSQNIASNPVAVLHYVASTFLCIPHSLAHRPGAALGAQAGGEQLADMLTRAGFESIEQVAATPEHAVYAAHP